MLKATKMDRYIDTMKQSRVESTRYVDANKMHIFTRKKEVTTRGKDLGSLFEGNSPLQQVKIGGRWREVGGEDIRDRAKSQGKET